MEILNCILLFAVVTPSMTISLWIGAKFAKIETTLPAMLVISSISSVFYFIPKVGWFVSLVVLLLMFKKFTAAETWPNTVLLIIAAWVVRITAVFILGLTMAKIADDYIIVQ